MLQHHIKATCWRPTAKQTAPALEPQAASAAPAAAGLPRCYSTRPMQATVHTRTRPSEPTFTTAPQERSAGMSW
jgi:hypothetical protein